MNSEEILGPDQIGEILIKTPFMMKGYINSELNKSFFGKDGFAHTGDLGYFKSKDYSLVFESRLKDLIKYQGNHLYPMELENIIKKLDGVAEVVVFGIPVGEFQELVTAIVIQEKDFVLEPEDIEKHVIDSGVESYKYIRGGVKFAKSIPKNATGKILRRDLPEYFKSL